MTEFQGVDVDALFPYWKDNKVSYRKMQKEAIMKALTALVEQDYDAFVIDAPVGYGKSAVIVTVSRVLEALGQNSYLTTPQLILQDQYAAEFPEILQIKGRSNYNCIDDPEVNCANGECQLDEKYHSERCCNCLYITQRMLCQESMICGMNTAYLMTVRKEVFDQRYLLSVDESHGLPEQAVGFVSVTIRDSSVNGFIPEFSAGFPAYILWLKKSVYPKVKEEEERLKEELKSFGKSKRKVVLGRMEAYKAVRDLVKKIDVLSGDYAEFGEDWTYNIETDMKGKKIVFQPLTSGRFLNRILWNRGKKVLLSSGTITPELYMQESGLNNKKFSMKDCIIEVLSEFDPKKSPIYYKSVGKLTYNKKAATLPLVLREIENVIDENKAYRGIIHCFSYDNLLYVVNNIRDDLKPLLWIQEKSNRAGSLDQWIKSNLNSSVFVSVNMSEGLNLKDDLARYQVYMKIGYPSMADKRVAKRLELNHRIWYAIQAIEDLEQSSGRATRSTEDWSKMYIFDSSFSDLYVRYNKYFKNWFKQRLVFIQN